MLVIGRRVGERIFINETTAITVLHVQKGKVKLGFDAPRSVSIIREEIKNGPPRLRDENPAKD
jgi:carbon storage regulator